MNKISSRAKSISESVTLKLNSLAVKLASEGRDVYNLTAGQLPFAPSEKLVDSMSDCLKELKSFQYSPVAGMIALRKKVLENVESKRQIDLSSFDCVVSNGAKHSLTNTLMGIINPGDEVIVLAPYWISYPSMISLAEGKTVVVESSQDGGFIPLVSDIKKRITKKTKAIIINSPNNPSGVFYPDSWIDELANLLIEHPDITIISDEIYYDLSYGGKYPKYLYQARQELLERTVIIDGISKNIACTGLRIGYMIADKKLTKAISNIQGQTASGANSLIQNALIAFDFTEIKNYLGPINEHLSKNATQLQKVLKDYNLSSLWYGPNSAFYFLIDLTKTNQFKKFDVKNDNSFEICQELIEKKGIVCVPGTDFGVPNTLRISLVLEPERFSQALTILFDYLSK